MTPTTMIAYCEAQLATIARQEADARTHLVQAQRTLDGLTFARQAYQDMIAELQKESPHGLDHPVSPAAECQSPGQ